ncbi:Septum formation [Frankia sp. EI5c]|nr:Septum formation [Frankia sp. EI5c]
MVALPRLAGAPPSTERFREFAEAACAPLFAPYRVGGDVDLTVRVGWYPIHPGSWAAGTRSTTCTARLVGQAWAACGADWSLGSGSAMPSS